MSRAEWGAPEWRQEDAAEWWKTKQLIVRLGIRGRNFRQRVEVAPSLDGLSTATFQWTLFYRRHEGDGSNALFLRLY